MARFFAVEHIGPLKLGMPAKQVIAALGPPATKGVAEDSPATGEVTQSWSYPSKGLVLSVSLHHSTKAPLTLRSVRAMSPCTLRSQRGISIGSAVEDVRAAYGSMEDTEATKSADRFVAGSIYGGLIFRFESGRVTSMFLGAVAE